MAHFGFVDLISASLIGPDKRKCDENNNSSKPAAAADEEAKSSSSQNDDSDEKVEKVKPKQMVGLFPLDLRSELKQRVGGKGGFSLKKSSTNIDIFEKKKTESDPIPIKLPEMKTNRPSDLLKSIQESQMRRKVQDDSDDEGGQEKLSFKEKLQLIERSSSKSLVNPLWVVKNAISISATVIEPRKEMFTIECLKQSSRIYSRSIESRVAQ